MTRKLRIDDEGRVWDGAGREVFTWTEREQDQLCNQLYRGDPVIRDEATYRKKAKSYSGAHIDLSNEAYTDPPEPELLSEELLMEAGGRNLLTLYRCSMNYRLAAVELSMTDSNLRKWVKGWLRRCGGSEAVRRLAVVLNSSEEPDIVWRQATGAPNERVLSPYWSEQLSSVPPGQ